MYYVVAEIHTIPYHTCHNIPYHTYHTISYHTIPYHTIPYIPYHTIPYHTIPGVKLPWGECVSDFAFIVFSMTAVLLKYTISKQRVIKR